MPIFHMSIFKVPSSVLQRLESIRSRFFKGHDLGSNKALWVKWSNVLMPKEKGGLGVSSLVIKAIHGVDGKVGKAINSGASSCWTSIVREVEVLKQQGVNFFEYLQLNMGNGESTTFWEDRWLEGLDSSFRRKARGGIEQVQYEELSDMVNSISLTPKNDRYVWSLSNSGDFSVASFRKVIDENRYPGVGSIMYALRCTRPDVAFAQNITSRFQQNPGELHWTALRVSCYTDAGYLTDADDLKSQTGYVFVLNGGVVDWKSTKQSIFATSSVEAEYIAASDASKEAVWVRKFIAGLGVVPTIEEPIKMYCDNTGAITIANESGITKGARHYRAKVYYLREVIEYGDVKLEKVHTYDNLADPFTKALAFPKHSEHTKNIGMLPASNLM
ncbi:hypothetical protein Tco_1271587 [Tanacetum coccineum]